MRGLDKKENMEMAKRIYVQTENAETWKRFLAEPEKHWKHGYSAMATAELWEKSGDTLPSEVSKALATEPVLKGSELLLALPEFQVPLPGGSRPSQNDLLLITTNELGLSVFAVEAKAREGFDKLISEWMQEASPGKEERLNYLIKTTHQQDKDAVFQLRYQLLHRLASAIVMAKKFHAKNAVMMVQSFVESDEENHYEDFVRLVKSYAQDSVKEKPILIGQFDQINIFVVWINSKIV